MSSALQPREWATYGNCGNWQPSSPKKPMSCPATAWMLSWPPVMIAPTTLLVSSTRPAIVTWFWMQFMRSIILKYSELAEPQRMGVATRNTSPQCTSAS